MEGFLFRRAAVDVYPHLVLRAPDHAWAGRVSGISTIDRLTGDLREGPAGNFSRAIAGGALCRASPLGPGPVSGPEATGADGGIAFFSTRRPGGIFLGAARLIAGGPFPADGLQAIPAMGTVILVQVAHRTAAFRTVHKPFSLFAKARPQNSRGEGPATIFENGLLLNAKARAQNFLMGFPWEPVPPAWG